MNRSNYFIVFFILFSGLNNPFLAQQDFSSPATFLRNEIKTSVEIEPFSFVNAFKNKEQNSAAIFSFPNLKNKNFYNKSSANFSILTLNVNAPADKEKTMWDKPNALDMGYMVMKPFLKNGAKSNGLWEGRYCDFLNAASLGVATGIVGYQDPDTARTIYARGLFCYFGYQQQLPLIKNHLFDIYPLFGCGFQYNRVENIKEFIGKNMGAETNGIGVYASGGLGIALGPLVVKAKVQALATMNTNKANIFRGAQLMPSVTVGLKPGRKLFDPDHLTVDGVRYYTHLVDEKYTATTYSYTLQTTYVPGSVSSVDVRPYFFLGPTYAGSMDPDNELNARSGGLCLGYRNAWFFWEASFESGNFNFMDPVYGNFLGHTPKPNDKNFGLARMDGVFINSSRVGMKFGIETTSIGLKKGFIPYSHEGKKKLSKLTTYTAIIPNIGFGTMHIGALEFADSAGLSAYRTYLVNTAQKSDSTAPFVKPGWNIENAPYTSLGVDVIFGALSFEYNLFLTKIEGKKVFTTTTWGLAYKLPIFRLMRMGKAKKIQRKLNETK
jgi:hypothetical protein